MVNPCMLSINAWNPNQEEWGLKIQVNSDNGSEKEDKPNSKKPTSACLYNSQRISNTITIMSKYNQEKYKKKKKQSSAGVCSNQVFFPHSLAQVLPKDICSPYPRSNLLHPFKQATSW